MFTFHRMSYLTALDDQFNWAYIWHQILVSWEGLILFISISSCFQRTCCEIKRVKFNYGRSRLPVLFWCTILKKYRHITLAKDYTLITFPKGRYAANMQRFHLFCLAHGNCILFLLSVYFTLLCRFSSNFIQGRAYTFCRAVSIQFCL